MAKPTRTLGIYKFTERVYRRLLMHTRNVPKEFRDTSWKRILEVSEKLLEYIVYANRDIQKRQAALGQFLVDIEILEDLLETHHDIRVIPDSLYKDLQTDIVSTTKQAVSWKNYEFNKNGTTV